MQKKRVILFLGALALCFLLQAGPAWAHYCDDHYADQQEREDCWWRYWNNQVSPQDLQVQAQDEPETLPQSSPSAESSGHYCDVNYASQQAREDCWWRFHNGLSLILNPQTPSQNSPGSSSSNSSTTIPIAPLPHQGGVTPPPPSNYMNSITVDCGSRVDEYKSAGWECQFPSRFGEWHSHNHLPGQHRHSLSDGETLSNHSH